MIRVCLLVVITLAWLGYSPGPAAAAPVPGGFSSSSNSSVRGAPRGSGVTRFKRFMGRLLHPRRHQAPVSVEHTAKHSTVKRTSSKPSADSHSADSHSAPKETCRLVVPARPTAKPRTKPPKDPNVELCRRFVQDRKSLDNDSSVEWVEGWHGVRAGNLAVSVPGIVADQGLFVSKSVSFMPTAAYWHPKKPPTPSYWTNSGAMVHFRVPKAYLKTMGRWVDDPSAGNRFKHASSVGSPRSQSNPNIEILPVQVLKVYWVKGDVPEQARALGVDVRDRASW